MNEPNDEGQQEQLSDAERVEQSLKTVQKSVDALKGKADLKPEELDPLVEEIIKILKKHNSPAEKATSLNTEKPLVRGPKQDVTADADADADTVETQGADLDGQVGGGDQADAVAVEQESATTVRESVERGLSEWASKFLESSLDFGAQSISISVLNRADSGMPIDQIARYFIDATSHTGGGPALKEKGFYRYGSILQAPEAVLAEIRRAVKSAKDGGTYHPGETLSGRQGLASVELGDGLVANVEAEFLTNGEIVLKQVGIDVPLELAAKMVEPSIQAFIEKNPKSERS